PFVRGGQRSPATTAGNPRVSHPTRSTVRSLPSCATTQPAPPIPRRSRFVQMATFAGTCYVAGYGATPLLSCDCVNCHQISAERHIATTIYSLRTCVENMVPQTFKKTQIDKAFRIATPK